MQKNKGMLPILIVGAVIIIVGLLWLNQDISSKQAENTGVISKQLVELTDENPTFDFWGKNFPEYLDYVSQSRARNTKIHKLWRKSCIFKVDSLPTINNIMGRVSIQS
ncbi:conserved hypothetical protein [Helicobacter hepaticus ATCC 51449]|uniref:Uncharacterized protein n=1 Tax=Helicobacter hepaticus (strain ATCC 51449 / 3B1) TaxID=235279 RepID=Q7VJM7_HELHP|nr:conserved hypothetical protein [Helicobacter hepaticus ATCC 51449]